jgi:release factor glutamine methyltransferase
MHWCKNTKPSYLRPWKPMAETLGAAHRRASALLQKAGVDSPSLDARLLLQAATGLTHAQLIAGELDELTQAQAFNTLIQRRCQREPVSRILGEREFHGLTFKLSSQTLDPRPDTETVVDAALQLAGAQNGLRILDLGTGTGAILLSLLAALPTATGLATDISTNALATAQTNATRLGLTERVQFICSNWFEMIEGTFDLIVSNPPYIPDADIESLSPEVRFHDPRQALSGGPDGLAPYRIIVAQAPHFLKPGGHLLVEIGLGQQTDIRTLMQRAGLILPASLPGELCDLGGIARVIAGMKPG